MLSTLRHKLEYFPVWLLATGIGVLPRPLARSFCQGIGMLVYAVHGGCARLACAILIWRFLRRAVKKNCRFCGDCFMGWAANWLSLPCSRAINKENVSQIAVYDGFQNFAEARAGAKASCF